MDVNLNKKIEIYSWIEPNNICKGKCDYNFDLVMPDIKRYFALLDLEKSPRKKFMYLNKIFDSINKLLNFNKSGGTFGVDDQMPILNYIFLRAKPQKMYSNLSFMKLYIGDKKQKQEDNYLTQLGTIRDTICNLNSKSLHNISENDFNENCRRASICGKSN